MVGRSPNKKVTVRTSGKSSAGKKSTTKRVKSELNSPISKQEVDSGESGFKDKNQRNSQVAKKNDRVSLLFLGVFIAALFFVS